MKKYEIIKNENSEFPYCAKILINTDGKKNVYCAECKSIEEATHFIEEWENEIQLDKQKNEAFSADEIIEKTQDALFKFNQNLKGSKRSITTNYVNEMRWLMDRIIPAIKTERVLNNSFSSDYDWQRKDGKLFIFGTNREQVVKKSKTCDGWQNMFSNCRYCGDSVVTLNFCNISPKEIADFFCEISPDVYVYVDNTFKSDECHAYRMRSNSILFARHQGKDYHDFTAEFGDCTPYTNFDSEEGECVVRVLITDKKTGFSFWVGHDFCSEKETCNYRNLVSNHNK